MSRLHIPTRILSPRLHRRVRSLLPLLPATLTLLLGGCSDSLPVERRLVVEGFIEDGGYPVVCLMTTLNPEEEGVNAADAIVRWGKVTISDGEKEVILTGGPAKNWFPPYTYTTYDIQGEAGKEYTLTAEYDGMSVTARTRIPQSIEIDSVTATPTGDRYGSTRLTLYGNCQGEGMRYFRVLTRVRYIQTRLLPGFMGTGDNGGRPGLFSLPVNRPKSALDTLEYIPDFIPGEEVEVALCTMEKEAFDFWRAYDNAVAFGGSQFLAPSDPLPTNIEGGYGYFFGYGVSRRYITIPAK